jgi:hypothetical protein
MTKKNRKNKDNIKKKNIITLRNALSFFAGLIGVLSLIFAIWSLPNPVHDFLIETFGSPLEINPAEKGILLSADANNWNEEFFIYLNNKTSNTYYDINITSEFPNATDVSILPVDSNEFTSLEAGNGTISIGTDFAIFGVIKESGMKITQTVINNIGPNETKKIKVSVNTKNYNQNFRLSFKVSGFNKTPKPIFSR